MRLRDKMVVLSNCTAGKEPKFHTWYNRVHIPDIFHWLRGYETAQRYELADRQLAPSPWRFAAIYSVAEGSLSIAQESVRQLRQRKAVGEFNPGDTLYQRNPGLESSASAWFAAIDRIDSGADDSMADHLLSVFYNAASGHEMKANYWYAEHAYEVVHKLPGFKSAERYVLASNQLEIPEFSSLTIYRIGDHDLAVAQDSILSGRSERSAALSAGRLPFGTATDSMAMPHIGWWFSPITRQFKAAEYSLR